MEHYWKLCKPIRLSSIDGAIKANQEEVDATLVTIMSGYQLIYDGIAR